MKSGFRATLALAWRRFLSLIAALLFAWSTCAPAATGDPPAGSVTATGSEPRVGRLVVRFRSGVYAPDGGSIHAGLLDELQASLGHAMSATSSTSPRNHILRLAQPVSLREAKRLAGLLRMRHDVVYAELDPSERKPDAARKTPASRGSGAPTIRRLLVTFADPGLAAKSRNNEKLDSEWDRKLSAAAGVPLRVARATIGGAWVIELLAAVDVATAETLAARLQAHGIARLAAPDYALAPIFVPNDPGFARGEQWNLLNALDAHNYSIDAERAWDITTGSPGTVIALIDSGILPHPELADRILAGYNFISDPVSAGNGVGRSNDATDLGDWRTAGLCPAPFDTASDSSWHGTAVAGVAAATGNNLVGMAGIDWQAKLLPVRFIGKCGGSVVDLIEAMAWAVGVPIDGAPDNPTPASIINVSAVVRNLPCLPDFQDLVDLILDAGVFIAAGAGNDNEDVANFFPANCLGLSAVGATNSLGTRASYSNFGQGVDISAPGGESGSGAIYSTWNFGTTVAASYGYGLGFGTSLATPQVAGVAALMLAVNPTLFPAQMKQLMAETASPFAPGSDCATGVCGAGIVNAYAAVRAAQTALPAVSPDLNQHGLTGSWYEPANSGQGFAVEIIPDQTPGHGAAFVSWFTFDTLIGGAERQRWYTLQGPVDTGQPTAELTIYQNTGGNFNAPPATNAQAVGMATLSFDTCSSGHLSYAFSDGTGRAGTVPLTRLLPNVTCSVTTAHPTDADFAHSGSWYAGPTTSGQGFTAEVAPHSSAFFLSWFTYAPNGANAGAAGQRWYTAQGVFTPGLRTIPVQIYETIGGMFDTSTPLGQRTVQVGSGTMAFQSCSTATFTYTFTGGTSMGLSGTITLGRVGPVPPGCAQ